MYIDSFEVNINIFYHRFRPFGRTFIEEVFLSTSIFLWISFKL